jgi:hypothetical protein
MPSSYGDASVCFDERLATAANRDRAEVVAPAAA